MSASPSDDEKEERHTAETTVEESDASALTLDSDEASRALARVQQIFDEDEERTKDFPVHNADKNDEALPITPAAAYLLKEVLEPLHPADIAWVLEACRSTSAWPFGTKFAVTPTATFFLKSMRRSSDPD